MSLETLTVTEAVLHRKTGVAEGVAALQFVAASGAPLGAWTPGAHVDLLLPGGIERQYSLCGDPGDAATWTIGVLRERESRGGSHYLHDELAEGATVRVRGPRNHFSFVPAERYLFIAGGIGITPLMPMIRAAESAGAEWRLHYAGGSRSRMAFLDELAALGGDRVVVYAADEGVRLDVDTLLGAPEPATHAYACGPSRLLDAVEQHFDSWHDRMHLERFEAREATEPVRHEAFEVELALTGVTVTVPPERTVLEVVEEAGALVLSSCREGTCGTCETPVLEGEVDHRDSVLTPDERADNSVMMICVSRAACPRLVLEL